MPDQNRAGKCQCTQRAGKADRAVQWLFTHDAGLDAAETTADGARCALTLSGAGLGSVSGQDL